MSLIRRRTCRFVRKSRLGSRWNGEELVEVIVPEIGDPVAQLAVVDRFVRELRLPPAEFFPSATPGHYTYCAQGRARSAWIHGQEWSITTTVPSRRGGSE